MLTVPAPDLATGSVDWTAVIAVAAALTLAGTGVQGAFRALRARPRRMSKSATKYLIQLNATAKAIEDVVDGRIELAHAQEEFTKLAAPEAKLRETFGRESAVHWVSRL